MANDDNKLPTTSTLNSFDAALLDTSDPLASEFLAESFLFTGDSTEKCLDAVLKMLTYKSGKSGGDGNAGEELPSTPPVEKDEPPAPNKDNDLDMVRMDNYSWGQTSEYIKIAISVPPTTMARDITCVIRDDRIKFGLKGQPPVLDGELFEPIKAVDSFWYLEEKKPPVYIILMKQDKQEDWWKCTVKGEPEIDTQS